MSARPGTDKTMSAGDGDKQARSPGRARRKPLKPLRAGMPGESGGPVVTMLVCFVFIARETAGAAGTRHSPRPHFSRRRVQAQLGRIAPRDRGVVSFPGCLKFESMAIRSVRTPAKAGDPVIRDVSDGIGKPRCTGYPAFAGYDGLGEVTPDTP